MKIILSIMLLVLGYWFSIHAQTNSLTKLDSLPTAKGKFAVNGLKTGRWVYFQSNGFKAKEGRYLPRIVKDSVWVIDAETFAEVAEIFYEEQKVGKWKYYTETGTLKWLTQYSKKIGKKKSITYSDNGLAFYERRKKDHFAERRDYHDNGKNHWVVYYNKLGKITGRFRKWDEDGKLIEKGRYRNGEEIGKWKIWNDKEGCYQVKVFSRHSN